MAYTNTLGAYATHRAYYDKVLHTGEQVRVRFESKTKAISFRQKCHKLRSLLRQQSTSGTCAYDEIEIAAEGTDLIFRFASHGIVGVIPNEPLTSGPADVPQEDAELLRGLREDFGLD